MYNIFSNLQPKNFVSAAVGYRCPQRSLAKVTTLVTLISLKASKSVRRMAGFTYTIAKDLGLSDTGETILSRGVPSL